MSKETNEQPWKFAQPIPPQPTSMSTKTLVIIVIAAFAVVGGLIGLDVMLDRTQKTKPALATAQPVPKKATCDKSSSMQSQRREAIDDMIHKMRIFSKVEKPGDAVHVYVSPAFYLAKYDSKKTVMEVVYCYYYDGTGDYDIVRIFDDRDGKQVGRFSTVMGLEMQ
jgi:hypothetical protein